MRRTPGYVIGFCGTAVLAAGAASAPGAATAQEPVTAFVHVSVVPMDTARVLADQTVLVQGARIIALGPAARVSIPAGAQQIDGRGKFLLPGLADMHVHLGDQSAENNDTNLFLFLANGVTTIRDMHSTRQGGRRRDNPLLVLQAEVARGQRLGPRIYTAGDPDLSSPAIAAQTTEELKGLTDFVKLSHQTLVSGPLYDSIAAAAARVQLKLVGHVPAERGLLVALRDRWASIEHLTGYLDYLFGTTTLMVGLNWLSVPDTVAWLQPGYTLDREALMKIARATRQAGVWNCPTLQELYRMTHPVSAEEYALLYGGASLPDWAETDTMSMSDSARAWHRRGLRITNLLDHYKLEIVKALHDAGAGLLLGTDAFDPNVAPVPGFSIHEELARLVEAGLTPYEALETGTRNVAEFLGTLDSTGTVAVGKRADLLVLNGDPLRDISYTADAAGVMVGGRWLARREIEARLDSLQTFKVDPDVLDLKGVRQLMWRRPVASQRH